MTKLFNKSFENIVTVPNLLSAWEEFIIGKRKRQDVIAFQLRLMDNILYLYSDLKNKTYRHGAYNAFNISDPKPRNIHKASVLDRLLHHLLYRETFDYIDRHFIYDSYSCRLNKGTHRAVYRFTKFANKVSKNNIRTVWVLKCDIRRFFASINHKILKDILSKYFKDSELVWLFGQVIDSFETAGQFGVGLPLGNLTSQLLANLYMNELDQFVKRNLKIKYYVRYADDFLFLNENRDELVRLLPKLEEYLNKRLKLSLHPHKIFLKTLVSGVDFLGWVQFTDHRILRTATKTRMVKRIKEGSPISTLSAYGALLKYGNTHKLRKKYDLDNIVL